MVGRRVQRVSIDAAGGLTEIRRLEGERGRANDRQAAKQLLVILLAGDAFDRSQECRYR